MAQATAGGRDERTSRGSREGDARTRGRGAQKPRQIPKSGWKDVLLRTKEEIGNDHVTMVAAGCAFYALLAIFPAVAAMISIWGLLADPQQIEQQLSAVASFLPQGAAGIIQGQATAVARGAGGGLSLAAVGGILITLYSASKGMKALMEGLNIIYDEPEGRGFLMKNVVALALTLFVIVAFVLALGMVAIVPAFLGTLGLGSTITALVTYLRWPLLFLGTLIVLAVLYKFAPSRERPRWTWVSWGAVLATILWVVGSIAFSIYVRNFGSYNATYGSLGAVVILLMWFFLSAFIVLMGAELNSEMEHQTEEDTTSGEAQPKGERGAIKADTLGDAKGDDGNGNDGEEGKGRQGRAARA